MPSKKGDKNKKVLAILDKLGGTVTSREHDIKEPDIFGFAEEDEKELSRSTKRARKKALRT